MYRPGILHIPDVFIRHTDGQIRKAIAVKIASGNTAATTLRRTLLVVSFGFARRVGQVLAWVSPTLVTLT
jgi:hypothetical protein